MADAVLMEKALGAYVGLAVGDALGASVEFMTAGEIAALHGVHKDLRGGGWLRLNSGEVTDDTQMSLVLGEAILANPAWDTRRVAGAFSLWLQGRPVDVGNTCRRGLRRFMTDGTLSGPPNEGDAGNGAAMRNLPVVLSTLHDDEAFRQRSLEQAHITHNHRLSDAGTLGLGEMTRVLLKGGDLAAAVRAMEAMVAAEPSFNPRPWRGCSSGYIVDTVRTVLDAFLNSDSLEECVVRAVNRGGDADTTGALAGQLAGALYGLRGVPVRWLRKLDPVVLDRIRRQVPALLAQGGRGMPPAHGRHENLERKAGESRSQEGLAGGIMECAAAP